MNITEEATKLAWKQLKEETEKDQILHQNQKKIASLEAKVKLLERKPSFNRLEFDPIVKGLNLTQMEEKFLLAFFKKKTNILSFAQLIKHTGTKNVASLKKIKESLNRKLLQRTTKYGIASASKFGLKKGYYYFY